ncbi:(Fe-S)-binding protein [Methanocella sp. CWC-04]|uniref:(Fe-S)-binding protein n=1 Tax=Methanooceanicella nereidis TaxID=2052831 RepID=A0AAP2RBM3_9EURY|nr:(Fe-S)-binding protein [Methanocella sp. CWC-04]MCD1294234.1 (Fe-S)-binding protein [Methanocella sp. CWC-04]
MIQDHIEDILKCTRCGRCRVLCPVNDELRWESTNSRGRMLLARALSENVEPSAAMKDSFYTCLTCSICSATCPSGAKPDDVVEAARAELVSKNYVPEYYHAVLKSVESYGNPLNDESPRNAWIPEDLKATGRSDIIFWSGCLSSYRKRSSAIANLRILSRFGAKVLEDERCCGSPLLRLGGKAVTMEHNKRQIEKSGAKTIVTGCAGCYKTLKESYDLDVEVLHISQFLARNLDKLELNRLPFKVSYHDPCHLGRCMKVYEEPRIVINRVADLVEMKTSGKDARCCGGGGGVRRGYRDLSDRVAKKRLQDTPEGVEYIVTACPMCNTNLEDAGGKVIDISELLLISLI